MARESGCGQIAPTALRSVGRFSVLEYSFVSVAVKRRRDGRELAEDYRDIIQERAAAGWEFVQAIPLEKHVEPRIDLVFTRKGRTS